MARKKRNDLIQISTRITNEQKAKIGEIATKRDLTEAQLIREFIKKGIELNNDLQILSDKKKD